MRWSALIAAVLSLAVVAAAIAPQGDSAFGTTMMPLVKTLGTKLAPAVVSGFGGPVVVRRGTGPWRELSRQYTLQLDDEMFTGIESYAEITSLADPSVFEMGELTQLLIGSIPPERERVRIRLAQGVIRARMSPADTNFDIQMPTASVRARGARFSVFYDRVARAALISVNRGTVEVDPKKTGLPTVNVTSGTEVEVTSAAVSPLARIGKAGARGGVNRATALNRVLQILRRANGPCGFITSPPGSAFAVRPSGAGWSVSASVTGKVKGKVTWTIVGWKVTPTNALAKTITAPLREVPCKGPARPISRSDASSLTRLQ